MKYLLVIPARAGSKRLKKKNTIPFFDELSLFDITYNFCKKLQISSVYNFDILVTTDDLEILHKISNLSDYHHKYIRPAHLSGDTASSNDAVIDAVKWYKSNVGNFDFCILLQVTSPHRTIEGFSTFLRGISGDENCFASVSPLDYKPTEILFKMSHGKFERISSSNEKKIYFEDGAYYAASDGYISKRKFFLHEEQIKFIMAEKLPQVDIDNYEQFISASALYKIRGIS